MLEKRTANRSNKNKQNNFKSDKVKINCRILGLEELPSLEELKKAYKLMVKQWHPDKFQNKPETEKLALKKTQEINNAYRFLLKEFESPEEKPVRPKTKNTRHNYPWQTYSDGFPDPAAVEFFLNSSHIVSAGYNKVRRILFLKFIGDEIFLYFDVPEFIFDHLLRARSPGKYAMKFVYDRFRHHKFIPIMKNFSKFL